MAIKKKSNSKQSANANRPRNGASRSKSPLLAKGARNGAPTFQSKTGDTDLRTYSIPDTRLEHPDLSVSQHIEKDKDEEKRLDHRPQQELREAPAEYLGVAHHESPEGGPVTDPGRARSPRHHRLHRHRRRLSHAAPFPSAG